MAPTGVDMHGLRDADLEFGGNLTLTLVPSTANPGLTMGRIDLNFGFMV